MEYIDRVFVDDGIELDGNRFVRCVFDGCVAFYNGGPVEIVGGFAFKNGGNIKFGPGIDPVENPISQFLIRGAEAQGFRRLTDDEIAAEKPITPKNDPT